MRDSTESGRVYLARLRSLGLRRQGKWRSAAACLKQSDGIEGRGSKARQERVGKLMVAGEGFEPSTSGYEFGGMCCNFGGVGW